MTGSSKNSVPPASEKLSRLVRFRTCSPAGGSSSAEDHRLFRAELDELFPRCFSSLEHAYEADYALLLIWPGTQPDLPAIALGAHWDVVPVDGRSELQWTHPPFSGHVDDEYVWGRGTLDDKISVAALLESVETLLSAGFSPARTVCICLGGDEESGGRLGAANIVEALERRGMRLEFLLDEGSVVADGMFESANRPLALIGVAEKGYANVRLRVTDEGGHASVPPRHSSADRISDASRISDAERIASAVHRLERAPFPARLTPTVEAMLRTASTAMRGTPRLLCRHPRLFRRLLMRTLAANVATDALIRTTQAVTMASVAPAPEVLPDGAEAVVNIRILPGDTVASVVSRTARVIADSSVTVELLSHADASEPVLAGDLGGEPFDVLRGVVHQVFPESLCTPFLVTASTDSHHYRGVARSIFRFTPLILRPADLRRVHGIDERVSHRNVEGAVRFYRALIVASAGERSSTP